ncbi:MAG: hypothetical protein Q8J65_02935 [Nitrosomonadales bacterium]|nr:hypothetical protein [Nitrosomonadales bacterium]
MHAPWIAAHEDVFVVQVLRDLFHTETLTINTLAIELKYLFNDLGFLAIDSQPLLLTTTIAHGSCSDGLISIRRS